MVTLEDIFLVCEHDWDDDEDWVMCRKCSMSKDILEMYREYFDMERNSKDTSTKTKNP